MLISSEDLRKFVGFYFDSVDKHTIWKKAKSPSTDTVLMTLCLGSLKLLINKC